MPDSTIAALQALHAGVSVSTDTGTISLNAPLALPAQVTGNLLPCALTFVGSVGASKFGTTTYTTLVLLAVVSAGINPDPIFSLGNALLRGMRDVYRPLGEVNGFAIDKSGHPTAAGGFGSPNGLLHVQRYGGAEYYGFAWQTPLLESGVT